MIVVGVRFLLSCLVVHCLERSGGTALLLQSTNGNVRYGRDGTMLAVEGFGRSSLTNKKKKSAGPVIVGLSPLAKKLLKRHGNNVDAASADYFQSQLANRQQLLRDDPTAAVDRTDAEEQSHRTRVAATWDTVALFLPSDYAGSRGRVDPHVRPRLGLIARACRTATIGPLLDVGCGDGALVPYLLSLSTNNNLKDYYYGIDVSSVMIDLARKRWSSSTSIVPKSRFTVDSFPPKNCPNHYQTILFNGSLQFFRDTARTLSIAASLLLPGGRIVIAHVHGSSFVQEECRKNPSIAVRPMPTLQSLQSIMTTTPSFQDCTIRNLPELFVTGGDDEETDLTEEDMSNVETFYLVVIEKSSSTDSS